MLNDFLIIYASVTTVALLFGVGCAVYAFIRLTRVNHANLVLSEAMELLYSTCLGFEGLFRRYYGNCQRLKDKLNKLTFDVEEFKAVVTDFNSLQTKYSALMGKTEKFSDAAQKNAKVVSDFGKVLNTIKRINPGLLKKAVLELEREQKIKKSLKEHNSKVKGRKALFIVKDEYVEFEKNT